MNRIDIKNIADKMSGTQNRPDYVKGLLQATDRLPENCRILEIGAMNGGSAITMALSIKDKGGMVFSIDPGFLAPRFRPSYYGSEVLGYGLDNYVYYASLYGVDGYVVPMAGRSEEIFSKWDGRLFDMIFIGGEHTYDAVKKDMLWAKYTKNTALIIFDDWIDVIEKACREYINSHSGWREIKEGQILRTFKKG